LRAVQLRHLMVIRLGSAALTLATGVALHLALVGPAAGQTGAGAKVLLQGAGATFPAPLYKKWIGVFTAQNPDVVVECWHVGRGGGLQRFRAGRVASGASDGALRAEQRARVKSGARLVPATAGMIVLAYNLPGLGGALKLSRGVYADIFLRKIVKW